MVSTRLMSIGNGSGSESNGGPVEGPAKFTRNSVLMQHYGGGAAHYSGGAHFSGGGPSGSVHFGGGAHYSGNVQLFKPPAVQFSDLPQEIIEKIFGYLKFREICKLRLVSRRIDQICGYMLNSTFNKLQNQMLTRFQDIKSKMPRRESARRSHYLACESDIIETLHMRLTLLQMSFGKHIERKHCCFFPGEILDEVYSILHYIKTTPKLDLPYKVTDELFDLSTMAMEYFKEKIEPNLPEIAYFSADFLNFPSSSSSKYIPLESGGDSSQADDNDGDVLDGEDYVEIPQSNMVLRKRIRKIKQGMKRYNSQLTVLRQELKVCKKKTAEQQKQITDQQKQLADQQKQTVEYATRLDEYDKKNEEISRKFSTLLQELNKCKTELQYWRCKSPATPPTCSTCGSPVIPPADDLQALMNQGVNPEGLGLEPLSDLQPVALLEQNASKAGTSKDDHILEPIKEGKEMVLPVKDSFKDTKDKKLDSQPASPAAAVRSAKRKPSEEIRESSPGISKKSREPSPSTSSSASSNAKKTRRLSKARCKRTGKV